MRCILLIMSCCIVAGCNSNKQAVKKLTEQNADYLMRSPTGVVVTQEDLETAIRAAPIDAKHSILGNGDMFMSFANNQYLRKQLVNHAKKNSLDEDPILLAKITDYKNRLLANAAVENLMSIKDIPDFSELARERYLGNQEDYKEPEQIRISHILFRIDAKNTAEDSLAKAEEVFKKAKQGQDFAKLAVSYSQDSSSGSEGDLGWVKRGQMIKPFEKTAFNLAQPGDISEVIKTKYGYHIIKLFDKRPERQLSFEEARPGIVQQLTAEHKKELQSQIIVEHDVSDQTEINKDAITNLYVRLKKSLKKNH